MPVQRYLGLGRHRRPSVGVTITRDGGEEASSYQPGSPPPPGTPVSAGSEMQAQVEELQELRRRLSRLGWGMLNLGALPCAGYGAPDTGRE